MIVFGFIISLATLHYYCEIYEPYKERINKRSNQFGVKPQGEQAIKDPVLVTSYIKGRDFLIEGFTSAKDQLKSRKVFMDYYLIRKNSIKNRNLALENMTSPEHPEFELHKNQGLAAISSCPNLVEVPDSTNLKQRLKRIKITDKKFELVADDKPLYIKGVSYNTGLDWKDGRIVLTRHQLKKDFRIIREMGANTITRDAPGPYDDNLIKVAEEEGLKVILGFQLDPMVNYHTDSVQMKAYLDEIRRTVKKYQGNKTIIAYTVGSKMWEQIKNYHSVPEYFKIRLEYVKFVNRVAELIHEIEEDRPVISVLGFSSEFPSELAAFKKYAPEIDVLGVSAFYEEQLSRVNECITQIDPDRPYLIYEYGPRGFWNKKYNTNKYGIPVEETSFKKAGNYREFWIKYIESHKGKNLGGIAFSWSDKLEGSATWFGITDMKGRKKPAYYALKEAWTKKVSYFPLPDITILTKRKLSETENIFEFRIDVSGKFDPVKHKVNWELYKYDFLKKVGEIRTEENGQKAFVTIPSEPALYRLYVEVTDEEGNVVTASKPIILKQTQPDF